MNRSRPAKRWTAALLLAVAPLLERPGRAQDEPILVRAGTVYTASGEPLTPGAVLVRDGKIAEVAGEIEAPGSSRVLDLGDGGVLMPGLIDADFRGGLEGPDAEYTREATPDFRPLEAIDRDARAFAEALAGGTTTAALMPGGDNVIGGLAGAIKTGGPRDLGPVVDEEIALVATVASDPTSRNRSRRQPDSIYVRQPTNRMGVVWILRSAFQQAARGDQRLRLSDPIDAPLDRVRLVLEDRLPIIGRARTEFDILTLLRIGEEFGFAPIVLGGEESYKVADRLASVGVPVILGPLTTGRPRGPEGTRLAFDVAGILHESGVPMALSGGRLLEQARFAARFGLPRDAALEAVTIAPARLLGLDDRLGSIEAGKDADLVALSGDPLEFTAAIDWVMVDGRIRFGAPADGTDTDDDDDPTTDPED